MNRCTVNIRKLINEYEHIYFFSIVKATEAASRENMAIVQVACGEFLNQMVRSGDFILIVINVSYVH